MIMTCRGKSDDNKFQFIGAKFQKKMKYLSKKLSTKSSPQLAWIFVEHIAGIDKADSTQINMRIMGIKSRERGEGCCSR